MDNVMQYAGAAKALGAWLASTALPWLVLVGLPAAISKMPTGSGPATWLMKVLHALGPFTHLDEPGTLKAPAGLSYAWRALLWLLKAVLAKGGPPAALLLIALSLALPGCTAAQKAQAAAKAKTVGIDAAKCAIGEVPSAAQDLAKQTYASLTDTAGAPAWADFGRGELLSHGIDLAICAVEAALHDLDQSGMVASASWGMYDHDRVARAHQRGVDWLSARGVRHRHHRLLKADEGAPDGGFELKTCDDVQDDEQQFCARAPG